jgi:amino acid adenylation domain-containing protein
MTELNERVAALSPEKRALLERRLQAKRSGGPPDRIPRREPGDYPLPLSFAQRRLWFLEQLEPGQFFYNLPLPLRLMAPVSVPLLEKCVNEIVSRHESLRTTFVRSDGRPVQVVAPHAPLSLSVIDLRDLPDDEREAEAFRRVQLESQNPFDLARGPLLRASLIQLGASNYVLLLSMHHIVSDGWSMGVLYRELAALYAAYSAGRPSPLDELPVQYPDFALWQRERLSGSVFEPLLSYWKERLAGMPAVLELPADHVRPPVQVFSGASYSVTLPVSVTERVKAVARQADATLFMTLLAAFKALLWRYTGEPDVVIGTPVAGRTRVELEPLIGFFVNTLVLRTDLSGDPSFGELVGRVRETTLGAYANQEMPFERLVEELRPERDLSRNPLFQIMFVLQNTRSDLQLDPQHTAPQFSVGTSKFDLTLSATETAGGLLTIFEYNTALFDNSTVVSIAENFRRALENAAADPSRRLSELLLLDGEERRRLTAGCNQTDDGAGGMLLIHQLCETQAARQPERIALEFGQERLTYGELNARANRLARTLRRMGTGPESVVGLYAERSADLIVGLLGVLKAGAAYLPLDPAYPQERLAYVLADTGASVLLTQERLAGKLPVNGVKVLRLDADWPSVAVESGEDLERSPAHPDNLAYVIYTSGSTGLPKGVLVPHSGVCNVAEAQSRLLQLGPESRILQFASLSFDASVFEIVMALRAGATLCLTPQDSALPGTPLAQVLRDEKINVLTIPPSALGVLPAMPLPDLHTLIVAGEACPAELVNRWSHGRRFFNAYGPTETSIWATTAECSGAQKAPPIGVPIRNTQVYVLDDNLEPVPVGVPGEIYIGGAGVTRGYHARPDLTAERFVPDPYAARPGARMYRTGDRARRLPADELEFLGRADRQVKLRGYRIEPGETEAALLVHPAVREAAAVVKRRASGEEYMAAYYVLYAGAAADGAELRDFLRQRLPDYMVPAILVPLDALPLTVSGKLDRHSLALLTADPASTTDDARVAPRTQTEQTLERIWREVLEVEQIGIRDHFFDLGGHSLLATRLTSRISDAFGIDLALRTVFEHATIEELAVVVDAAVSGGTKARGPAIETAARRLVTLPAAQISPSERSTDSKESQL